MEKSKFYQYKKMAEDLLTPRSWLMHRLKKELHYLVDSNRFGYGFETNGNLAYNSYMDDCEIDFSKMLFLIPRSVQTSKDRELSEFIQKIDETLDYGQDEMDNLVNTVVKEFEETALYKENPEFWEFILQEHHLEFLDAVYAEFYMSLPYENYFDKDVDVNISIDTGDHSLFYSLNTIGKVSYYSGGSVFDKRASLYWLAKQQGYSREAINHACMTNNLSDLDNSPFLQSLRTEIDGTASESNQLFFLCKMTYRELLELRRLIRVDWFKYNEDKIKLGNQGITFNLINHAEYRKGLSYITIKKDAICGLYDVSEGTGSEMGLQLEKDVKLPLKFIDNVRPDESQSFPIKKTFDFCSSCWKPNLITIYPKGISRSDFKI